MPSRKVYHLALSEDETQGAAFALLPGDPFRSKLIADRISDAYGTVTSEKPLAHHREYCTYLAEVHGAKVLVTSTGIGGPSTSIAVEELAQLGVRTFIRVGTAGAIQDDIDVGDVVITTGSVRLDGASTQYAPIEYPAVAHHAVLRALIEAASQLERASNLRFHVGITASTDTFYQGQERRDTYSRYVPRHIQGITQELRELHALNYEMESSTLLTMCSAFGLRGGCVTGAIANRASGEQVTAENLRLGETNAVLVGIKAIELLVRSP